MKWPWHAVTILHIFCVRIDRFWALVECSLALYCTFHISMQQNPWCLTQTTSRRMIHQWFTDDEVTFLKHVPQIRLTATMHDSHCGCNCNSKGWGGVVLGLWLFRSVKVWRKDCKWEGSNVPAALRWAGITRCIFPGRELRGAPLSPVVDPHLPSAWPSYHVSLFHPFITKLPPSAESQADTHVENNTI